MTYLPMEPCPPTPATFDPEVYTGVVVMAAGYEDGDVKYPGVCLRFIRPDGSLTDAVLLYGDDEAVANFETLFREGFAIAREAVRNAT